VREVQPVKAAPSHRFLFQRIIASIAAGGDPLVFRAALRYFRGMFITGIGLAAPSRRYTQRECWDLAQKSPEVQRLTRRSQAILRKVLLGDNGIAARHLALESLHHAFELDPDALHKRFFDAAPALAVEAARNAMRQATTDPSEFDALIISTCTGYLCPGLTSYVSEQAGLRPDALLLDLVGQGCGAALPNLQAAESFIRSGRARRVLSICVEVCSAAFYLDDDLGVLVSACLFGDGAAAAILSNEPGSSGRRVELKAAGTILSAADREYLRFEQKGGMLRNILARQVPDLAGKHAEGVLTDVLARSGLTRDQIACWILHPGGREVLEALRERLRLSQQDLRWSSGVLLEYGNLSSASVLFVLRAALDGHAPGGYWWMSAFGAGFSCHGALLQVT
jgi:predicted naringenin-chalcone synthase